MGNLANKTKEQLLKEVEILETENADLKKNKEIFQIIAENAVDNIAITTFDLKAKYLYVSPSVKQTLGYEPEDLLGKSFFDFIHPKDKSILLILTKKYINLILKSILRIGDPKITETIEYRFKDKAGNWHYMQSTVSFLGKDLLAITRDITGYRQAEEKAIQEKNKAQQYLDIADIILVSVDSSGIVKLINPKGCEILGYSKEEIMGHNWFDNFLPARLRENVKEVAMKVYSGEMESVKYFENEILTKSGNERLIAWHNAVLRDNKGKITGTLSSGEDITECKQADEKLRKNEKVFQLITENAFDFIWTLDLEMNITYASNSVYRLLGYTPEEITKINVSDLYSPDQFKMIQKLYIEELSKGAPSPSITFTATHLRKDKTEFPVEVKAKIVYNEKKEPIVIQGYTRDISTQVETEKKLIRSEERYRTLFNYYPDPVLVHDGKKILDVNPAILSALGLKSKKSLKGTDPFAMIHPQDREKAKQRLKALLKDKKPLKTAEFRIITPQNEERTVLATPVPVIYDDQQAIMINYHDITERKNAEQELQQSEERFKRLFEGLGDSVYVAKIGGKNKGRILEVNPAAVRQMGYTRTELLQMNIIRDVYVSGSGIINTDDWDEKLLKGETVTTTEKKRRKDGTEYWTEVIVTPFEFKGEKASLSINHDITIRKKAEEGLIKALKKAKESDRLKSAFLANMSHEIRTPMNGILGFAELLKEPGLTGNEQLGFIEIIEKSGNRMLSTINDIINISKVEAGQMEVSISKINVNEQMVYLHTFFKPEADKKGIQLSYKNQLPEQEAIISTDLEKLFAILTNLIKNSIKYSNEGSIEFGYVITGPTTKSKKIGEPVDKTVSEPVELKFYVKDTGIGIPKDRQRAIFDRFVQADIDDKKALQGSGLGLSISKAYVKMLGGKMWVKSEEGIGSQFYFTIPCKIETIKKEDAESNAGQIFQIKKLKILIAEDEENADLHLTLLLENFENEILHAKTGIETFNLCRNNTDIDLILMDIRMPEMGGYETTRKIREFNNNVTIIAQTAYAIEGDREKALEAGCDDYISKPIKKEELLDLIEKHFSM